MRKYRFLPVLLILFSSVQAAETEILDVQLTKKGQLWSIRAMLQHPDTGWDHYADAWRVVTPEGEVLGTRLLTHPHVNEQPFTRSLNGVNIPRGVTKVIVEARDSKDGWAKQRVVVDLRRRQGPRYRVSAL